MLVFKSTDADYFISHVDVTKIKEYRAEVAKLTGEASIVLLFRYLSACRLVTIAQIEGRVRAAGNEFVLACDMRFAAREKGGGAQHLARLLGRARALEVMLSAEDYDAELAERYGWINRALPADGLGDFVSSLIAGFPAAGHVVVKDRVNAIALAPVEDFRRDSDLFGEGVRNPELQRRTQAAWEETDGTSNQPIVSYCLDALHQRHRATDGMLNAFDLLELNGKDLRSLPLGKRNAKLEKLLADGAAGIVDACNWPGVRPVRSNSTGRKLNEACDGALYAGNTFWEN